MHLITLYLLYTSVFLSNMMENKRDNTVENKHEKKHVNIKSDTEVTLEDTTCNYNYIDKTLRHIEHVVNFVSHFGHKNNDKKHEVPHIFIMFYCNLLTNFSKKHSNIDDKRAFIMKKNELFRIDKTINVCQPCFSICKIIFVQCVEELVDFCFGTFFDHAKEIELINFPDFSCEQRFKCLLENIIEVLRRDDPYTYKNNMEKQCDSDKMSVNLDHHYAKPDNNTDNFMVYYIKDINVANITGNKIVITNKEAICVIDINDLKKERNEVSEELLQKLYDYLMAFEKDINSSRNLNSWLEGIHNVLESGFKWQNQCNKNVYNDNFNQENEKTTQEITNLYLNMGPENNDSDSIMNSQDSNSQFLDESNNAGFIEDSYFTNDDYKNDYDILSYLFE